MKIDHLNGVLRVQDRQAEQGHRTLPQNGTRAIMASDIKELLIY